MAISNSCHNVCKPVCRSVMSCKGVPHDGQPLWITCTSIQRDPRAGLELAGWDKVKARTPQEEVAYCQQQ